VAQRLGPTKAKWGWLAPPPWPAGQVLAPSQILLCKNVKEGQCMGYPMRNVGVAMKLCCQASLAGQPA
jgi:hypothetical protein